MASVAGAVQGTLEQFIRPHLVHASFPLDRFFNKMAFMVVIVQAIGILVANFAAQAKISCTLDGDSGRRVPNDTGGGASMGQKTYAESYCYSQGVDQTNTPNHTIPADFQGVLNHYLLQFYLPLLFLLEGVSLYMPYYVWSNTVGEHLREHIQFVVDLSLKLLQDQAEDGHEHTESCKNRRMQHGRPSKTDVLTDSALKQRLKRWYCKSKHTTNYYYFQATRLALLLGWIGLYSFCPGFRHRDIRYRFLCVIRNRATYRYMCVLLQASVFEIGWTSNMCILTFCLLLIFRQVFYFFPYVVSCRCLNCRTKRCLASCRKECRSHYFQRILGIVIEPKREPPDTCCGGCCVLPSCTNYEQLNGTDFYSSRLVDRYYISHLCYENSHLLDKVLPDMGSANAPDEFSSLGNIASIAMKLDNKADDASANIGEGLGEAKKPANPFLSKLRKAKEAKAAAETAIGDVESAAEAGLSQAKSAAEAGEGEAKSTAEVGLTGDTPATEAGLGKTKLAAKVAFGRAKSAAEGGASQAKAAADAGTSKAKSAADDAEEKLSDSEY